VPHRQGDSKANIGDLMFLANDWLQNSSLADIATSSNSNNIVNFLDFEALAENWFWQSN
jgi:hypothetical protein